MYGRFGSSEAFSLSRAGTQVNLVDCNLVYIQNTYTHKHKTKLVWAKVEKSS